MQCKSNDVMSEIEVDSSMYNPWISGVRPKGQAFRYNVGDRKAIVKLKMISEKTREDFMRENDSAIKEKCQENMEENTQKHGPYRQS